jgi:hypothetical protein
MEETVEEYHSSSDVLFTSTPHESRERMHVVKVQEDVFSDAGAEFCD